VWSNTPTKKHRMGWVADERKWCRDNERGVFRCFTTSRVLRPPMVIMISFWGVGDCSEHEGIGMCGLMERKEGIYGGLPS
jgi:hypothetical protein